MPLLFGCRKIRRLIWKEKMLFLQLMQLGIFVFVGNIIKPIMFCFTIILTCLLNLELFARFEERGVEM